MTFPKGKKAIEDPYKGLPFHQQVELCKANAPRYRMTGAKLTGPMDFLHRGRSRVTDAELDVAQVGKLGGTN